MVVLAVKKINILSNIYTILQQFIAFYSNSLFDQEEGFWKIFIRDLKITGFLP
jgi:hypothetical protein